MVVSSLISCLFCDCFKTLSKITISPIKARITTPTVIPTISKLGGAITGGTVAGIPGALVGILFSAGAEKLFGSALFKTRVANILYKLSSEEAEAVVKNPVIRLMLDRVFGSKEKAEKAIIKAHPEIKPLLLGPGAIRTGQMSGIEVGMKNIKVPTITRSNVFSSFEGKEFINELKKMMPLNTSEDYKAAINTLKSQNKKAADLLAYLAGKKFPDEGGAAFYKIIR